jgi:hypothetical protein
MPAFKVELHFGQQQSFESQSSNTLFAFHSEPRKLSARNSLAARPLCSRNQSSSATSGERVAGPRMHGFSFFLGSPHFGHTHEHQIPFLASHS